MRLYHMRSTHRGHCAVPSSHRLVFHSRSHHTTKGTGLLLSENLGGFGLTKAEVKKDMTQLKNKLSFVAAPIPKKKRYINL